MIIWLASYPKSGNTWVRLFIDALLNKKNQLDLNSIMIRQFPLRYDYTELSLNPDNIQEFISNCTLCQNRINLDNSTKVFKTHNSMWRAGNNYFTNEENTKGVIHIVRDPRNVITSVKNHFNKENYDEAFNFMTNEKQSLGSKINKEDVDLPTVVSSWSNHFNSWKKMNKNYLLIKYENLIDDPKKEFMKLCDFLESISSLKFEKKLILKAIENCEFYNLKKQEISNGFLEGTTNKANIKNKFFYLGPENDWKKLLNKEIKNEIEILFEKEMKEVGYL